jgi:L-threonylcarbamoyladenylate synthase
LLKHYAPKARLVVVSWSDEDDLIAQLATGADDIESIQVIAHTRVPSGLRFAGVSIIPHDAEAYARALYAELHRCDQAGIQTIVVEAVPTAPEWRAIADRLSRASAPPD